MGDVGHPIVTNGTLWRSYSLPWAVATRLFPSCFGICCYWRYVALVVVLWRPVLSASSSSLSASVTALRWEPVNVHV